MMNKIDFYVGVKEEIYADVTVPYGKDVEINARVDVDHEGDHLNPRSHTEVLVFKNLAPFVWYLKHQKMIDLSNFGSE